MFLNYLRRLSVIALPVVMLTLAGLLLPKVQQLPAEHVEMVIYAPYLAVAFGLLLSLGFNRGRVFYMLLMLGFFYWSFRTCLQQGITGYSSLVMFQSFSILMPLNVSLFCWMKEKGIFSRNGQIRFGFLLVQVVIVAWIIRFRIDYVGISGLLGKELLQNSYLTELVIPQLALAVLLVGFVASLYRSFQRGNPVDSGLMGALVALGIACNWLWYPQVTTVYVTAAALILAFSVIKDSHNMAFRDDLTGLPSRRALNEQLLGLGKRFTVAMLDVDHFKRFNDTYGHDIGDQVLKMVGGKINDVRGGGKPYRYGGEEFTVIFPGREPKEVIPHLEDLRQAIASYQLWIRGNDRPRKEIQGKPQRSGSGGSQYVSVTISIGVAACNENQRTADEVIRAADKALYRAKERGRNQVCT